MTETSYNIRPATAADLPAVAALDYDQTVFHYELDPRDFAPIERGLYIQKQIHAFEKMLSDDGQLVLVAEADGLIAGYLAAKMDILPESFVPSARLFIEDVYVVPDWRKRGVANALLDHSYGWGRNRGAQDVLLMVKPNNRAALALYDRHGYETIMLKMRRPL